MFRNVLVGLDGGAPAEQSLDRLKVLAPDARLTLLRAYRPLVAGADPWMSDAAFIAETNDLAAKSIRRYLQRVASRFRLRANPVVLPGSGASALLDESRRRKYDLIAITTHGGQSFKRRFIGGTTEKLIHHANLPLLVVPVSSRNRSRSARIRRIAVPLDGSRSAEFILPIAERVAKHHRAEIVLVHVFQDVEKIHWESGIWGGGVPQTAAADRFKTAIRRVEESLRNRFDQLVRTIERKKGRAVAVLVRGDCPKAILDAAAKNKCDMIAMCVHGHGALEHLLQGSMASKIIQETPVPVLLARHDRIKARSRSVKRR